MIATQAVSISPANSSENVRKIHSPSKLPSFRFFEAREVVSFSSPLSPRVTESPLQNSYIDLGEDESSNVKQGEGGAGAGATKKQLGNLDRRTLDSDKPQTPYIVNGEPTGNALESKNELTMRQNKKQSTASWLEAQESQSLPQRSDTNPKPALPANQRRVVSLSIDDKHVSRPKISPIRGFKPSRNSTGSTKMTSTRSDEDDTIKGLEDFTREIRSGSHQDQASDESEDLFLRMAREEEAARQRDGSGIEGRRRSRLSFAGNRMSMPASMSYASSPRMFRRSSEHDNSAAVAGIEEQALTHRSSVPDDGNRYRYNGGAAKGSPTTPKGPPATKDYRDYREISPELSAAYTARRPSVPDYSVASSGRSNSYRQSNLSYSTPKSYNSSPLGARQAEVNGHSTNDHVESPRAAEGTESTTSTTAPSTVWDELEELKSRIHRLELTGKLPSTSGAAVSRASGERPRTATTTVTTISTSPRRRRGNSVSPLEVGTNGIAVSESHPLLQEALAKSKVLLNAEVYKALEAATADALAIATMMGSSGQPGPISSSQSTIGIPSSVSDRQVRRKADSLCRGLTELCLALSEATTGTQPVKEQIPARAVAQDPEISSSVETSPTQTRPPISNDLSRLKSSPRTLSRLEARRSSLLAPTSLSSPRYAPSEVGTPSQTPTTGRRTSLYLRTPRRAGTEELEEDESRFRAPSRAVTEISRPKNSPREYASQQPVPEARTPTVQSSLPVRRHFASASVPNSGLPAPTTPSRRFFERSTPERDAGTSRLTEDRTPRKSSIGGFGLNRIDSVNKRSRHNSVEPSSNGPNGYQ